MCAVPHRVCGPVWRKQVRRSRHQETDQVELQTNRHGWRWTHRDKSAQDASSSPARRLWTRTGPWRPCGWPSDGRSEWKWLVILAASAGWWSRHADDHGLSCGCWNRLLSTQSTTTDNTHIEILYFKYIFYGNLCIFKYNLEVSPVLFAKTANLHFEQPFGDLGA